MAALSDHAEKRVLDWLLTTGAVTRPTQWRAALFTTATTDAGGGTEVSGAGYARQSVTFGAATTPGGTTSNTNTVSFTASGGNFGTVTHAAIYDAATGGNPIAHGPLASPRTINNTDTLTFAIGAINVTID